MVERPQVNEGSCTFPEAQLIKVDSEVADRLSLWVILGLTRVVTKLPPLPQLQHLVDRKFPFRDDWTCQQGQDQTLWMGIPCPSFHIRRDGIFHLFRLGSENPQTCQDMVWGVDDEVANLDVVVQLKVELEAEGTQESSRASLKDRAFLSTYIQQPLCCCQPPFKTKVLQKIGRSGNEKLDNPKSS